MPEYTYICNDCSTKFSIVCAIREYKESLPCIKCKSKYTVRSYEDDLKSISGSVRLAVSELNTVGHLAHRNTETMSDDQRNELYRKHNAYKEVVPEKPLPKGMKRIKKPPKIKWR